MLSRHVGSPPPVETTAKEAPAGQPSAGTIVGGVEFEVERPKGDAGEMIDPEQLNLF